MYDIIAFETRFVNEVWHGTQLCLARVAIKTELGWKAYEGVFVTNSDNQHLTKDHPDLQRVAAYGKKLTVEEMLDTPDFEQLPTEFYGI